MVHEASKDVFLIHTVFHLESGDGIYILGVAGTISQRFAGEIPTNCQPIDTLPSVVLSSVSKEPGLPEFRLLGSRRTQKVSHATT